MDFYTVSADDQKDRKIHLNTLNNDSKSWGQGGVEGVKGTAIFNLPLP